MSKSIPCTVMRGGTSKGVYFLKSDLPSNPNDRDRVLLNIMGSPDHRQIDGMGGANSLTSKIAIINKSDKNGVDVDYLFGQVSLERPIVSYVQNCGNILAGVGQFAIEKGLVAAVDPVTKIVVNMLNSNDNAIVTVSTPEKIINYEGETSIDGVPGTAAAVPLNFLNTAGSVCGSLFPTGNRKDVSDGITLTCIDNGMPLVIMRASDFNLIGTETVDELELNESLKRRLERVRLDIGPRMNLGDVEQKSVPKMTLVSPPKNGGLISTRSFIPHACHSSIGVFAAVTVATASLIPGTLAAEMMDEAVTTDDELFVEHPSGAMGVRIKVEINGENIVLRESGFLRTARKIFEGSVFIK